MSSQPVTFPEFRKQFRWKQGEHVVVVAPTEAGKTTLLTNLMPYRGANLFFGTKVADPLYRHMVRNMGYTRVDHMAEIRPWHNNKILLWPHKGKDIADTMLIQQQVFHEAINDIAMKEKPWTLWLDEAKYMAEQLRLGRDITFAVEQFRTIHGTIICGAQRPAYLPQSVLSNASHAFLWKTTHRDDAMKLADMGGIDAKEIRDEALTLGAHEWIYIHTRGTVATSLRSQVER